MPGTFYLLLIPLLPLASFVLLGLFGRKLPDRIAGLLGTLSLTLSCAISVKTAVAYFSEAGISGGAYQALVPFNMEWLRLSDSLSINMGILLDPISVMMIVVVTFVSLMVHVYSLGYMKGEERYSTYYSFLSLFTFSMLGLVLAVNIFQTYIFWELVGVSSFLLIGFYYQKPSAVAASKKAFIVTRFADLGFLIGILVLSYYSETMDFLQMKERLVPASSPFFVQAATASFLGVSALTWGLTLVFIGGAGKSAMFPLHIWLPDAMEGPTPVSALIHAATMVVAGVYLVARLFPIYALACPAAMEIVTFTGAFSAFFAAIIACTQTDIKRILAYSTMSQIGYMMFALGVSGSGGESGLGFTASMFHLFTHAMFKALLFLGAGAVIHYVHSNEMGAMGGLRKKMPVTHIVFLAACLAIAGIPPFSGFFSKEEILLAAFHYNKVVYFTGLITAGITAFYMFRLYFGIFWSRPFSNQDEGHKHGEGPATMLLPLVILGILATVAGFVPFGEFVSSDGRPLHQEFHLEFSLLPVGLSLAGILIATVLYRVKNNKPDVIAHSFGAFYRMAKQKFMIDEVYTFVTKKVIFNLVGSFSAWFDKTIVNGFVNTLAAATQLFSLSISGMQSGKLQSYAGWMLTGLVGLALFFLYLLNS